MDKMMIVSSVAGALGMIVLLLCYQLKSMRSMLLAKFTADCFWALHYFLIGGYAAMIVNMICATREIIYVFDHDKKRRKIWLVLFLVIGWIISYVRWNGILSVLPTIAFSVAAYSFWQKDVQKTKVLAILNACMMFTYDVFVVSYIGMISEGLTVLTVLPTIIKSVKK